MDFVFCMSKITRFYVQYRVNTGDNLADLGSVILEHCSLLHTSQEIKLYGVWNESVKTVFPV